MHIKQLKDYWRRYHKRAKLTLYAVGIILFCIFTIHSYFKGREKEAGKLFCHAQRIYWDGRVEDARKLFERINTELPDTPSHKFALFYLAKIYLEKGEHNKAMDVYKKLTKVCKEDAFLFLAKERLARLAMDEGKYELALSLYRELLKMPHPPLRTPHLKLCVGRCIQHLNEEEAIKYYTSFIKEYKESEYARYAAAFLSQIRKGR